jgi:hypothetical protein
VSAKDKETMLFSENGDMNSMKKYKKETCSMIWQFLFIICIILTKWSLAHFAELRGLSTSSQDAY